MAAAVAGWSLGGAVRRRKEVRRNVTRRGAEGGVLRRQLLAARPLLLCFGQHQTDLCFPQQDQAPEGSGKTRLQDKAPNLCEAAAWMKGGEPRRATYVSQTVVVKHRQR
jgi:hypothetical protein